LSRGWLAPWLPSASWSWPTYEHASIRPSHLGSANPSLARLPRPQPAPPCSRTSLRETVSCAPPSSDGTPLFLPLDAPAPCRCCSCCSCRCPPCTIVSTGPSHDYFYSPDKVTTLVVWPLPSLPCRCGCYCCRCRYCCEYCCRYCCRYCCCYGCLLLRLWEQQQPSCKIRASDGD